MSATAGTDPGLVPYPWHRAALARFLADRSRLPHAVLVHGAKGIGKAQFARALGAAMLCESPREGLACGTCSSCHWLGQGNHPDFREIVPEAMAEEEEEDDDAEPARSEARKSLLIKIEQVRRIADFITLSTHRSGYRVLLVRPAEALHPAAANALLKTLEEPPPSTLIILVSNEPSRLLATLRSRCRKLGLPLPAEAEALAWLEARQVPQARSALAAAGGAPLLALELAEDTRAQLRRRVVAELARPEGADPTGFSAAIDREALEGVIYWMQTWVHDLVQARMAGGIRHHVELAKPIRALAQGADLDRLFALDRTLSEARRLASHPLNPRLVAEHLLMAYNQATSRGKP